MDPSDSEALVGAMLELSDPMAAAAAGRRALEHSARYTWEAVTQRIVRALGLTGVGGEELAAFP